MTTEAEFLGNDAPLVEKGVFDVLKVAKGGGYPEKTVTLYFDREALYRNDELERTIALELDSDKVVALEKEQEKVQEQVKASGVHFTLRGLSRGLVNAIKTVTKDENEFTAECLAKSIVRVVDAEGNVDGRDWTKADIDKLFDTAQGVGEGSDLFPLLEALNDLTFRALRFETVASDPDF